MPNTIDSVVDDGLCSGCGACAFIAPSKVQMRVSGDGFARPRVCSALTDDESALFRKVCPGLTVAHPSSTKVHDPLWGPIREIKVGYATDPDVRFAGSSGGIVSALAIQLLETGKGRSAQMSADRGWVH